VKNLLGIFCVAFSTVLANGIQFRNELTGAVISYESDGTLVSTMPIVERSTPDLSVDGRLHLIFSEGSKASIKSDALHISGSLGSKPELEKIGLTINHQNGKQLLLTETGNLFYIGQFVEPYTGEPYNYTSVTTYGKPGTGAARTSKTYYNGLGMTVQEQSQVNGAQWLVSATTYDYANRPLKSLLPTPHITGGQYVDPKDEYLLTKAQGFHNDGQPYSEVKYLDDLTNRRLEVGAPGSAYGLNTNCTAKSWHFGIVSQDHFIPSNRLRENGTVEPSWSLKFTSFWNSSVVYKKKSYDYWIHNPSKLVLDYHPSEDNAQYLLSVNCDENGRYTQSISDKFGNTLAVWSDTSNGTSASGVAVVRYEYDDHNRLTKEIPADPTLKPTLYTYNEFGLVKTKETPDAGITSYEYEQDGRLRSETRSVGSPHSVTVEYQYDSQNRLIAEKVGGIEVNSTYYNRNTALVGINTVAGSEAILNQLTNLRGNVVGTKFKDARPFRNGSEESFVVDLFSYDDQNRISAAYRNISGFGWTKKEMTYTFAGELETVKVTPRYLGADEETPITLSYTYNDLGELIAVDCSDKGRLVSYEYAVTGELTKKKFYGKAASVVAEVSSEYNIRGWPTKTAAKNIKAGMDEFSETMSYAGEYGGNITSVSYTQAGFPNLNLGYRYNGVGTLTNVTSNNSAYAESFAYDLSGRMAKKVTGNTTLNYTYVPGTSRIASAGAYSYSYDYRGNVITDNGRNTAIAYSWNNMAHTFTPPASSAAAGAVYMQYDGNNNRVKKEDRSLDRARGTLYTANMVYTSSNLETTPYELDYYTIETPMGTEGKIEYDESGNKKAYFYLTDHLGSTRSVISEDGTGSYAANFTAYGELKELKKAPDDVRENFTGKELDTDGGDQNGNGGMAYVNFGSRYYDPVTGVFMAVDPQDQFFNAYSYVGGNPVMMIDPNGEIAGAALGFWIGAGAGAIIGGAVGGNLGDEGKGRGNFSWENALIGAGIGAIAGGLAGYGIGSLHDYATSFRAMHTITPEHVALGKDEGIIGVINSPSASNGGEAFGHNVLFTYIPGEENGLLDNTNHTYEYMPEGGKDIRKLMELAYLPVKGLGNTQAGMGIGVNEDGNFEFKINNDRLGGPSKEIAPNIVFFKTSITNVHLAQEIARDMTKAPYYHLYLNSCTDLPRTVLEKVLNINVRGNLPSHFMHNVIRKGGIPSGSF